MEQHPDHKHILALRQGDFSTLDYIYREHAPTITQWVVRNSGSVSDAQDVFQEGIIALHQKAQDPTFLLTCPLGALLFQICRNKWFSQLRKKNRETEVRNAEAERYESEGIVQNTLEQIEEEEIRQRKLDQAFGQLSELCQQLLQLLASGMASAEVAEQLGMNNANTVYRRKNACAERWRNLFNAQTA
ncbi:RNA polymerase sigma factor [Phaeodactylibacter xiamenensis]|uniref:RNA polymerase sigma factor n=1 Tax=Phaeodactylibacter xiamenensis TaxID=1524460 RepID=UPI0024A9AB10|nr:sigma-70 family RNA polymerase sigma factor [Phaeodactylibacter xiamenensis]